MSRKDLTGQKFGRLTAIKYVETRNGYVFWECLCECGKTIIIGSASLNRKHTHSCGCFVREGHFEDLTGKSFGWLTVLKCAGKSKHRSILWECQCKCGIVKIVSGKELRTGGTTTCGNHKREQIKVLHKKNVKYTGSALERKVLVCYKSNAKRKGYKFSLSEENFYKLIHQPCYYCGTENSNLVKNEYSDETMVYNGIDRLDSKIGYTESLHGNGNCVTSCRLCNRMKLEMGEKEFLDWVKQVKENLDRRSYNEKSRIN
jgi:hypothetical protein